MKKLFLYLFSIILIIFISPKVYALSNFDTYYDLNIPESSDIFTTCIDTSCTKSIYDFMEDLISFRDTLTNPRNFYINLVRKDNELVGVNVYIVDVDAITFGAYAYGLNPETTYKSFAILSSSSSIKQYEFNFWYNKPTNITLDSRYVSLLSCLGRISCPSYTNQSLRIAGVDNSRPPAITNDNDITFDYSTNYRSDIYNDHLNFYPYYSSRPFTIDYYSTSSNDFFYKSLRINGVIYGNGSILPTYRTLYFPNNSKRESAIGNIYIGSIPVNSISDFKYSASFYYEDYDYATSLNPLFLFYGRKSNTGYYSYESLDCHSPDILGSFAINQELKKVNFTLLPYGFSCTNNLTQFDYIYIRVYFNYNTYSDNSIMGYNGGSNYGNSARLTDSMATYLGSDIYEVFENQPYDFSYVLSTLAPETKAYYIDNHRYITMSLIRQSDNYVEGASYNPIIFGQDMQKNAIIYNLQNYYTGLTYLRLFLNSNTIVSGKIQGAYYYYDSGGTIIHDDIVPRQPNSNTDDYDTSYYKNIISSYIDDLTIDIDSFGFLIQTFYDNIPSSLQMFVYISFLLLCFWFVYILVRK